MVWVERGKNFDNQPIEIRLKTRDITPVKFDNVRFSDFYIDYQPIGDRNIFFRYLIDGRLSEISGSSSNFLLNLDGESIGLGFIKISNQKQTWTRVQPKIKYSRGTSVSFEIYDATLNLDFIMQSIGINVIKNK